MKDKLKKKYYHISDVKNKNEILEKGLIANNGEIFLFSKLSIASEIAFNQLGIEQFSIFEINSKGIDNGVINDNVAESTAKYQWIAMQDCIHPCHTKHLADKNENVYDMAEETNRRWAKVLKLDEDDYVEFFVIRNPKWVEHYNAKYGKNLIASDNSLGGLAA
jgi:hypothetical protein